MVSNTARKAVNTSNWGIELADESSKKVSTSAGSIAPLTARSSILTKVTVSNTASSTTKILEAVWRNSRRTDCSKIIVWLNPIEDKDLEAKQRSI
jgi:hypothetical protein